MPRCCFGCGANADQWLSVYGHWHRRLFAVGYLASYLIQADTTAAERIDDLRFMNEQRRQELIRCYRDGLLHDTLPFWIEHGVDREHGGIMTSLDRDGSVVDSDKGVWQQGRFTWLMGELYNNASDVRKPRRVVATGHSRGRVYRPHVLRSGGWSYVVPAHARWAPAAQAARCLFREFRGHCLRRALSSHWRQALCGKSHTSFQRFIDHNLHPLQVMRNSPIRGRHAVSAFR